MKLKAICIKNFRRLINVKIDCEPKTTIFVGANNSGKTSVSHILRLFLGNQRGKFSVHDFSAKCWEHLSISELPASGTSLPTIQMDLWFTVDASDLANIIDILPGLDWQGNKVGVRLEYAPRNTTELLDRYREARAEAAKISEGKDTTAFQPWPATLMKYLTKRLRVEYKINYYVLDSSRFSPSYQQDDDYIPRPFGDDPSKSGVSVIDSLVKVDFLDAQRHLGDDDTARNENISTKFNQYYKNHLEKSTTNFEALQAINASENDLTNHFEQVFEPLFTSLKSLGYPGLDDPQLVVKAVFNTDSLLSQHSRIFYPLTDDRSSGVSLPDRYNGLGFKNLIYMLIELLDFHERWVHMEDDRPPLHLLLIEEPEAHLHSQLQQVFIRKVYEIIGTRDSEIGAFQTQLVVSTHSPHITYESGFVPIRYFRRVDCGTLNQSSEVLSLSDFYEQETQYRDFLQRYMKLTHSELFFADAAILVEGAVERLLLPAMIEKCAKDLMSCSLTILEVGGAFAHCFKNLIEFLSIPTLVITDLDSCDGTTKSTCLANQQGAISSNQTLKTWLPGLEQIDQLLTADEKFKMQCSCGKAYDECTCDHFWRVRVAYQTLQQAKWKTSRKEIAGRTIEESIAFENMEWSQHNDQKAIGLQFIANDIDDLILKIHNKIHSKSFKKTDFALNMMLMDQTLWKTPQYIDEGLKWLSGAVSVCNISQIQG